MNNLLPPRLPDFMVSSDYVASAYRVYVIFSRGKVPLWTPLFKLLLSWYQKSPVYYTHTLLAVQDMLDSKVYWYEMDYFDGMQVYESDYSECYYDGKQLTLVNQTFYTGQIKETFDAVDVTTVVSPDEVEDRWERFYTNMPLTPMSLLTHLTPANSDKITWTCTGLTQALLTGDALTSYLSPKSPDQLYTLLTQ